MESETIITEVNDNITIIEPVTGQRFGTDALLLAAFARPMPKQRAAEIGTGSGIVSLLCMGRNKFNLIDAIEVQEELAKLCTFNIERNKMQDRINAVHADVRDFCGRKDAIAAYSAVLCNPPYMRADSGFASIDSGRMAARHELNGDINELCTAAAKLLRWGGLFYTVYRPDRAADLICALRASSLEPKKILFVCDEAGHSPCLMLTEAKLGAKPSLIIPPTFILRRDGNPTKEFSYLLDNGSFPK